MKFTSGLHFTLIHNKIVDIDEKPEEPKSNVAIGGIYLFDELFWEIYDYVLDARGGEFSISDVSRVYVKKGRAKIRNIGRKTWIDCGTPSSLLDASNLSREGKI